MKELGKKFNIFSLKKQANMGIRKHLHFLDNWMVCSGQRFWEIAVATIEERLRLYGSKTFSNHGFGDASWKYLHIPFLDWAIRKHRLFFDFPY